MFVALLLKPYFRAADIPLKIFVEKYFFLLRTCMGALYHNGPSASILAELFGMFLFSYFLISDIEKVFLGQSYLR